MKSVAMELAKRQKRLNYWQERFARAALTDSQRSEINAQLNTFALLLAKVAKAGNEGEANEAFQQLLASERELANLFEALQYKTSPLQRHSTTAQRIKP